METYPIIVWSRSKRNVLYSDRRECSTFSSTWQCFAGVLRIHSQRPRPTPLIPTPFPPQWAPVSGADATLCLSTLCNPCRPSYSNLDSLNGQNGESWCEIDRTDLLLLWWTMHYAHIWQNVRLPQSDSRQAYLHFWRKKKQTNPYSYVSLCIIIAYSNGWIHFEFLCMMRYTLRLKEPFKYMVPNSSPVSYVTYSSLNRIKHNMGKIIVHI